MEKSLSSEPVKEGERTQILLILYDNKPDTPLNLQELADIDTKEGRYIKKPDSSHPKYRMPSSSITDLYKTEDGRILLYSIFKEDHDLEKFKANIEKRLRKKYGDRFSVQDAFHLMEHTTSSPTRSTRLMIDAFSKHRHWRC